VKRKLFFTFTAIIVIISIILLFAGSIRIKRDNPYYSLADLGGVYNSSFEDIDFSIELTGKVLGDGKETVAGDVGITDDSDEYDGNGFIIPVLNIDGLAYSNKLMRWGISRKPDNQIPDADPGAPELISKYNGFYLGDTSKKEIYLTFDEGYENGYTPKILDVLKENNVKAVFFITGPYLNQHQDLVRRMVEEGHVVGNHTIHHTSLPSLPDEKVEEEILGLERAFKEKFGKSMRFIRPPMGEYSERTLAIANKLGYETMFWSFAYDDWYRDKIRGPEYTYKLVMNNLHNGAILLLHAVSKDNADALDMIIKGARERGYTFGDIEAYRATVRNN